MLQDFWGYLILNSNNQYNAATEGGPEAGAWEKLAVASYIIPHFIVCCANMTAMDGGVSSTSGADTACSAVAFSIAYGIKTLEEFLVGLAFALVFKNNQV